MLRILATLIAVVAAFAAGLLFHPVDPSALLEADRAESDALLEAGPAERTAGNAASEPIAARSGTAAAAIAELLGARSEFALSHGAYALAAHSDVAALEALIVEAERVPQVGKRTAIMTALVTRYAELDPVRALAFVRFQRPSSWQRYVALVFVDWSIDDFDAAVEAAARLASSEEKRAAADGIRFAHEPADLRWLAELGARLRISGSPFANAAANVAALADRNPQAAIAAVRSVPADQRATATFDIGRRWGSRDPEAAYRYTMTLPADPERFHMLNGLFDAWGRSNPRRVIEILETGVPQQVRESIVDYGIANMARMDPAATFERLGAMRNVAARDAALKPALLLWAEEQPEDAALALDRLDAPGIENELANIVGALFARAAPERALDWAHRYDGGYGTAWRAALGEIAREHPTRAVEIAASVTPDKLREITIMVLGSIAQTNPLAATEHWERLPAEMRSDGAFQIVREWVQTDTAGATNWLLGGAGGERDAALRFLAEAPTLSAERLPDVINAIGDERRRVTAATAAIQRLLARGDRTDAELLLSRLTVPQESSAQLRARIDGSDVSR